MMGVIFDIIVIWNHVFLFCLSKYNSRFGVKLTSQILNVSGFEDENPFLYSRLCQNSRMSRMKRCRYHSSSGLRQKQNLISATVT